MFKLFKFLFFFSLIVLVAGVFALGYFGFLPGVSKLMGTDKPKDLGVTYTQQDYEDGLEKAGVEVKDLPSSSNVQLKYEGSHEVKDNFSSEVLTAHASEQNWAGYPLENVQVRINPDNTCEVSGVIKLTQIDDLLSALNVTQEQFEEALDKANIPLADVPFYAKGYGTAKNNTLDAAITNFEVGRFPVPKGLIDEYNDEVMAFGESVMRTIDGFSVKEARFEDGGIYFDGNLPDVEYSVK